MLAAEALGWPFLRAPLERALSQRLQSSVILEPPFRLQLLWRPGVQIGRVQMASPARFEVPHLAQAEQFKLRWSWLQLLQRGADEPWPLRLLQAQRLDARLVRLADGSTNWSAAAGTGSDRKEPDRNDAPAGDARAPAWPVTVAALLLDEARIDFRDQARALDLRAEMSITVDGPAAGPPASTSSRIEAMVTGSWAGQSVEVQAQSDGLPRSLAGAAAAAPAFQIFVQGRVGVTEGRFSGIVSGTPGAPDISSAPGLRGSLLLRGASLAHLGGILGITLPSTPAFRVGGALRHQDGVWGLVATEAHIGGSRLLADLKLDTRALQPRLSGSVGGEVLRLQDLGPAIGTAPPSDVVRPRPVLDESEVIQSADPLSAPTQATTRAGRVLPSRPFDLPSLRGMDADVAIDIGRLELADPGTLAPLQPLKSRLTLLAGVLTLNNLEAGVAGGLLKGMTRLDASATDGGARWLADLRLIKVQLERWVPALRPGSRDDSPVPMVLSGDLDMRLELSGTGQSTAEILATLNGQAGAQLRDGQVSHLLVELAGLDVAQALGVWLTGDDILPLKCAVLAAKVDGGVVQIHRGLVDTSDSQLHVDGKVDLNDESLALRVKVEPKDFSPLSLRTPLTVGGTLAEPDVSVKGERLAGKLLAAAALAAATPLAALLPLLEFGDAPDVQSPCLSATAPAKKARSAARR